MPRFTRHVLVAMVLALLLLGGVAAYFEIAQRTNNALTEQLQKANDSLEKEILALQEQGIDVAMETFSSPTLLDILMELATKMPESQITISQIHIAQATTEGPWITIQGSVKNDAAFPSIVDALKNSTLFTIEEPDLKLAGGKSTFTINARKKSSEETKS